MSLLEGIREKSLEARRTRHPSAAVLSTLIGEIETRSKSFSPARPVTDEEVLALIRKLLKSVQENVNILRRSGEVAQDRKEDLSRLIAEKVTLEELLPQQMDREALRNAILPMVRDGLSLGAIMARLRTDHPGMYDGKLASDIARDLISRT